MSSGVWYRTLVYLGLKEEPEEGYDDPPERVVADPEARSAETRSANVRSDDVRSAEARSAEARSAEVHHDRFDPVDDPDLAPRGGGGDDSNVRPLRATDAGHIRSLGGAARLAVVDVSVFEDVEAIGTRYRTGQPVLFDVAGADRAAARRVVDFVSGLTYALRGSMSKVGARAFLLVPDGVDLPDEEVRRMSTLGYHLDTGSGR